MKVVMLVAMVVVLACLTYGSTNQTEQNGCSLYCKYDIKVTHPQAVQACKDMGGRIALPLNKEEDLELKHSLGLNPAPLPWLQYWISGTDAEEEGKWVDSVTGKPLTYLNFKEGEPNNALGIEDCISVSPGYFGWNDYRCDWAGAGYVCDYNKCGRDGTPLKCPSIK